MFGCVLIARYSSAGGSTTGDMEPHHGSKNEPSTADDDQVCGGAGGHLSRVPYGCGGKQGARAGRTFGSVDQYRLCSNGGHGGNAVGDRILCHPPSDSDRHKDRSHIRRAGSLLTGECSCSFPCGKVWHIGAYCPARRADCISVNPGTVVVGSLGEGARRYATHSRGDCKDAGSSFRNDERIASMRR